MPETAIPFFPPHDSPIFTFFLLHSFFLVPSASFYIMLWTFHLLNKPLLFILHVNQLWLASIQLLYRLLPLFSDDILLFPNIFQCPLEFSYYTLKMTLSIRNTKNKKCSNWNLPMEECLAEPMKLTLTH